MGLLGRTKLFWPVMHNYGILISIFDFLLLKNIIDYDMLIR